MMEKLLIQNRKGQKIAVLLEKSLDQKGLAFVMHGLGGFKEQAPQLARFKDLFRAIVAWEDTEKHKPDPEPLQKVMEKLGVMREEAVYIGDVENDLKAARAAGTKFIFFPDSGLAGADGATQDFKELPRLIDNL